MRIRHVRLIAAHLGIVSSLVLATLAVLDDINPRMGFLRSGFATAIVFATTVSTLFLGISEIVRHIRSRNLTPGDTTR